MSAVGMRNMLAKKCLKGRILEWHHT